MSSVTKIVNQLSLDQGPDDLIRHPFSARQALAAKPSRAPQTYAVPGTPPNAGPDNLPGGFNWAGATGWDASNPPMNNTFAVNPGDTVDFLNYGALADADLQVSSDASSTTAFNLGSGGTQSFAWALTSGETYKVRWTFNADISHDNVNDGFNVSGNVGAVVWAASNPAAITQSGNSLRWVPGQTANWIEIEFTATGGGFVEIVSNGDGWLFTFENYGLPLSGGATNDYLVSVYSVGGVEYYEAVNVSDIDDVLSGLTPLPAGWNVASDLTLVKRSSGTDTMSHGELWTVTADGHTLQFPAAPIDGQWMYTQPPAGGWSSVPLASFATTDTATVAAGQTLPADETQIFWEYESATDNWKASA